MVLINGSGVDAMTLALPIAGAQDGLRLHFIYCVTAHAHTVTTPAAGFNGADHVLTFTTAGDFGELVAYNGTWYLLNTLNGTLS